MLFARVVAYLLAEPGDRFWGQVVWGWLSVGFGAGFILMSLIAALARK